MKFKNLKSQEKEFAATLNRLSIYKQQIFDDISIFVDIGVSDGRFIAASMDLFPNLRRTIGVDPIDQYSKVTEFEYVKGVVGPECTEIQFRVAEDLYTSSRLYGNGDAIFVKQFRMDCLLRELKIESSSQLFVKIDTQGTDLECLASFGLNLESIKMAIVEVQMRPIAEGMHFFTESILEISQLGFEVIEFLNPIYRNHDGSLGQIDLLLVPKTSPILESKVW